MRVEVDQSGKIERTDKNTILAFSNQEQYTILIDKKVKQNIYSKIKERKILQIKLFVIGVYLLLKSNLNDKELIVIDEEYQGKERLIKRLLLDLIRKDFQEFDQNKIRFERISKASNAHKIALSTYRKIKKPDRTIKEKEIMELFNDSGGQATPVLLCFKRSLVINTGRHNTPHHQ